MNTRYKALTVVLEQDIQEEDLEGLTNTIRRLRGVTNVRPEVTDDLALEIAEERAKRDLTERLRAVLRG